MECMRQRLAWVSTVPLLAAGLLAGHALAYRLAIPDGDARAHALAHSGHGYLAYAPAALAVCLTLVLAALALRARAAFRGESRPRSAPPAIVAMLPPAAFVLQEYLERVVHSGHLAWTVALAPTFLLGLALQLPVALAALVVAQILDWLAHAVGVALAGERPRFALLPPALQPVAVPSRPRVGILARGYGERAPPSIRQP